MRKLSRWLLLLALSLMATTGSTQKSPRAPAAPTPAKLSPRASAGSRKRSSPCRSMKNRATLRRLGLCSFFPPKAKTTRIFSAMSRKSTSARSQSRRRARRSAWNAAGLSDRVPGQHAANATRKFRFSSRGFRGGTGMRIDEAHRFPMKWPSPPQAARKTPTRWENNGARSAGRGSSLDFFTRRRRQQQPGKPHHQHTLIW